MRQVLIINLEVTPMTDDDKKDSVCWVCGGPEVRLTFCPDCGKECPDDEPKLSFREEMDARQV
jgi:hypothetical protein